MKAPLRRIGRQLAQPLKVSRDAAVGGPDKLLRYFRMKERYHSGPDATPPEGKTSSTRESFLDGSWDATGLLLYRFEDVEATKQRLPYVNGWR